MNPKINHIVFINNRCICIIGAVHCEDETIGPIFMKEPPNRVDFSNTTGAVVECAARGSPTPDVIWVRADGTAVGDVPGLRQVTHLFINLYLKHSYSFNCYGGFIE